MKTIKIIIGIVFYFCFAIIVNAQIEGTIINKEKKAIGYANISLLKNDTSFISGTSTDINGNFSLNMPVEKGAYTLSISCLSYETINKAVNLQTTELKLGAIILAENTEHLSEIAVTADRIERNATGYKINLKGDKSTRGKQITELLPFLPGITNDNDNIKVLGRKVSVVYLDGVKLKNLKELEAIPANLLESATIDYMAGSDEAASSKGAVIHLKLSKRKENGYYGNIKGGITYMPEYGVSNKNISSIVNAKVGKLNIYNNLAYSNRKAIGDISEYKLFKSSKNEVHTTEELRSPIDNVFDRLSLTYDLNNRNELGVSILASMKNINSLNSVSSNKKTDLGTSWYKTEIATPLDRHRLQATANYKYKINKLGSEFTLTADYLRNDEYEKTEIKSLDNGSISKSNSNTVTDMYELNSKLKWVFKSRNKIQAGINFKYINTDYDRLDMLNKTEISKLTGQMPAFYTQFSGRKNKLQYEIGLRLQQNKIEYSTQGIDKSNENTDFDFYPSLSLMYMLNPMKGNMLMFSYKRTVDDIPYSAISPYKRYSSEYSYTTGNPDLISPKTDMFMAVLNLFQKYTISSFYIYGHKPIYFETSTETNTGISYLIPQNGDYETVLITNIEGRFKPVKWWKIKATASYFLYSLKNKDFEVNNQSKFYFSLNNDFVISKSAGATLSGYYEPTADFRDRVLHKVYQIKGSVYKRFIKDRLEVKLNCKFYRQGRFIETKTSEIYATSANNTNEQFFELSLKYSFHKGKKVRVKRTKNIQNYKMIEDVK